MKKIAIGAISLLLLFTVTTIVTNAFASESNPPTCKYNNYEIDADEDNTTHLDFGQTGGKVDIVFNVTNGVTPEHNHRNQVIVTAGSGYEIVNVQYELEHYSGIGWTTVPGSNPTTTITLPGTDDDSWIDEVEIKLRNICTTPTPTATGSTENNSSSSTPPAQTPQCSDPGTTKVPANIQVSRNADKATVSFFVTDGNTADVLYKQATASDWQYSVTGLTPNVDKFISTEIGNLNPNLDYTFGARQRFGCGGGEIVTTGTGISQGEVLGASTMASTGTFENTLMNLYAIFGMLLVAAGFTSYAKEKKLI